ncbi:MAG: hypothetical protein E7517_00145 [Ruminococcaceae bacterium]|nr:hypothetical protein [Oscillospiraceae bacterium]
MRFVRCNNDHFYDEERFEQCPYCEGEYREELIAKMQQLFTWKSDYTAQKIKLMQLTLGDLPVKNILWNGETISYFNRINGSRDGGLQFDEDFFDETVVTLSESEQEQIRALLCATDFLQWKTPDDMIENAALGSAGFYAPNAFKCEFESGERFCFYLSNALSEDVFSQFGALFHSIEEIIKPKWKEYKPTPTKDKDFLEKCPIKTGHYCPCCGCELDSEAQFCSSCGKNLYLDPMATVFFCPVCHGDIAFEDIYCRKCGIKQSVFNLKSALKEESDVRDALYALERLMEAYKNSNHEEIYLLNILLLLKRVPLFFSVEIDIAAMLGDADPLSLKPGDTLELQQDVKARLLTVNIDNLEIVPAFTKGEYANTSVMRFYPVDYIDMLIKMEKPMVINFSQEFHFVVPVHYYKHLKLEVKNSKQNRFNVCSNCRSTIDKASEYYGVCQKCDASLEQTIIEVHPQATSNIGTILGEHYQIISTLENPSSCHKRFLALDMRWHKIWEVIEFKRDDFELCLSADTLKRIDCFGIPRIGDVIEQDGNVYLLQTYMEGKSLWDIVLETGPQAESDVRSWAAQVCSFLEYFFTFSPKIVHRDIKPQVLLLDSNNCVHLSDYSIAMSCDCRDIEFHLGTLGFAAPEQFSGQSLDCRTDIFGLGRTMFFLLTGINPAKRDVDVLPVRQYNANLSRGIEYIVDKCIKMDPNERYQTPRELLQDFNNVEQLPPKKGLFNHLTRRK